MNPIEILEKIVEVRQRRLDRGVRLKEHSAVTGDELEILELDLLQAKLELAREPLIKEEKNHG